MLPGLTERPQLPALLEQLLLQQPLKIRPRWPVDRVLPPTLFVRPLLAVYPSIVGWPLEAARIVLRAQRGRGRLGGSRDHSILVGPGDEADAVSPAELGEHV